MDAPSVKVFDIASLPATPWKNGGGSTREIACWPVGAGLDDFEWRVSIARIEADGPFSVFAGIDRVIMLLDGPGVELTSNGDESAGIERIAHRLDAARRPFAFDGGAPVEGRLLGGPSNDFNVMSRRARVETEVRVLTDASSIVEGARFGLLLALEGSWTFETANGANDANAANAQSIRCAAGQGLWWHGDHLDWRISRLDESRPASNAALVAVRFKTGARGPIEAAAQADTEAQT